MATMPSVPGAYIRRTSSVDALPHVFDRFYRGDRARARKQGGAGLGLALVRAMVEANNGTIAVESQVNQGSQFTVRLPIIQ